MTFTSRHRNPRHCRLLQGLSLDLSPHLMRDLGLPPRPESPRLPFPPFW